MNICLITPLIDREWGNQIENDDGIQLGIGYVAAYLEKAGYFVDYVECNLYRESISSIVKRLNEKEYDMIGVSAYTYNFRNTILLIRKLKNLHNKPFIFLGGYLPTTDAEMLFKVLRNIDCCVLGEGEQTALELVQAIETGNDWHNIPGLAYSEGKEVVLNPVRDTIRDLDSLPFPKRVAKGGKKAAIISSRGCYGKCRFCSAPRFYQRCGGQIIRKRSPENVVEEIKYLLNTQPLEFIKFNDDNFVLNSPKHQQWINRFCTLLKREGLNIPFRIMIRANDLLENIAEIQKLQEVGLKYLFIGFESLVQRQLDFYNKKITSKANFQVLETLHRLQLRTRIGFILLDPFVTLDEIKENVQGLKKSRSSQLIISDHDLISNMMPLVPILGSDLYDDMKSKKFLEKEYPFYTFQKEGVEKLYNLVKDLWVKKIYPINQRLNHLFANTKICQERLYSFKSELFEFDLDFIYNLAEHIQDSKSLDLFMDSWIHKLESLGGRFNVNS